MSFFAPSDLTISVPGEGRPKMWALCLPVLSPTGAGGLPRILTLAQERVETFFYSPKAFPDLFYPEESRVVRSERRQACVVVLKSLLSRMDLNTLSCGTPTHNRGFVDISMKDIMKISGLGQRRCERAIAILKGADLIYVRQPRRINEQGEIRGCRAIRIITHRLFEWLRLDRALARERRKARERLEADVRKFRKNSVHDFLDRLSSVVKTKLQKPSHPPQKHLSAEEFNQKKAWMINVMLEIDKAGVSNEEAMKVVNHRLGLPIEYKP